MQHLFQRLSAAVLLIILLLAGCAANGAETGTSPLLLNGPGSDLETAVNTAPSAAIESEPAANPVTVSDTVEYDERGIEVGFTAEGRPYRGNPDAPVVLEEYSDFQCPFCARFAQQTLPSLLENQVTNGEVLLIFYDFPLTNIHAQAAAASHAARCAGEQGAAAYWAMHDLLFDSGDQWANSKADEMFVDYATQLGLDVAAFTACQADGRYEDAVTADMSLGQSRGVSSTPSFFLNGQMLVGAQPLETFNSAIAAVNGGQAIATEVPAEPQQAAPAIAPTPVTIVSGNAAYALGNPTAGITIVEFTDYQCPYCARHVSQTLPQIVTDLIETGRVYYVVKDFPLEQIHPQAATAAAAARCAGEQEAYWEMHDLLFSAQESWSGKENVSSILVDKAFELGLDTDAFSECLNSGRQDQVIQDNLEEGIALGVRGTPSFFINGYPVSGAQPFELFTYAVELAEAGTLADAYVQTAEPTAVPTPSGPVNVPTEGAYAIGDPNAPVTIVEFTDFQCPYCSRHFLQTFPQIKENYIDKGLVYYVFRDFPLTSIHPQAELAAEAARCAGDQGAYVEMHDALFSNQQAWSGRGDAAALFARYAADLGLDETTFTACLESNTHQMKVYEDLDLGSSLGINGTPAFFVNGYFLNGAQPYSTFAEAVDYFLEQ
ncbi:MAG: DsbA family protein [Ardenticatenaceae bacterium]|nr:DsbA family protein [Anaerolineales bacterium]MCB8919956.1 DsbA family protein [Ardenticatenaceae bacterium]